MTKITFTTTTLPCTLAPLGDPGEVPDNFASIAHLVCAIACANGDAGWLADMLHEAESAHRAHYPEGV